MNRLLQDTNFLLSEVLHQDLNEDVIHESQILSEGAKEKAIDAVQFLISSAVEYGIDVPTLGAGAPLGSAAETIIDAAFGMQSISSTVDQFEKIVTDAGKFKDIFNEAMKAKGKINGDLPGFYSSVKRIIQKILNNLGDGAKIKVKEFAAELKTTVSKMADTISDSVGDAVKFLIPDAAIGTATAEALQQLVGNLSNECFDLIESSLKKAGKLSKFVTDPLVLPAFVEEAIPKLITFLRNSAKKIQDASIAKALAMGGGAGLVLKQLGPMGLKKLAGILEDKKQDISDMAKKISGTLIPIVFAILAITQILLKGEFIEETKSESKLRSKKLIAESRALLKEIDAGVKLNGSRKF